VTSSMASVPCHNIAPVQRAVKVKDLPSYRLALFVTCNVRICAIAHLFWYPKAVPRYNNTLEYLDYSGWIKLRWFLQLPRPRN
jgi:hypothetical protein